MNKNIYLDTDIIMDFLTERDPFYPYAALVFEKIEKRELNAFVSSLIIWNIYYWLEKYLGNSEAKKKLKKFRMLVDVISIDSKIIDQALDSNMKDFEDSVQYFAAISKNIPIFLTRNKKDFKKADIRIMDCSEFLASSKFKN